MRLHAVGACPQLQALHHCAWGGNSGASWAVYDAAVVEQPGHFWADTVLPAAGADASDPPATPAPHTARAPQAPYFGYNDALHCSSSDAYTPASFACAKRPAVPCLLPCEVVMCCKGLWAQVSERQWLLGDSALRGAEKASTAPGTTAKAAVLCRGLFQAHRT